MRNYWIAASDRFRIGNDVIWVIKLLEDEETGEKVRASELNLPSGYLVPSGYYDQTDKNGKMADYVKISKIAIIDSIASSPIEISIDGFINLWCSRDFLIKNGWY
jgi:hypothetical protein